MIVAVSAQLGLFALWLLTANVLLGLLLSVQYNPLKRWPYKRINYFSVHNWSGYIALALSTAHAALLPLSSTAGWVWGDVLWPAHAPQQAQANELGAVALYLLALVVVTSYVRRKLGRKAWKLVHWATYGCAVLFLIHSAVLDPRLLDRPVNYFDPEKASVLACAGAVIWATWLRIAVALRRRRAHRAKSLAHWDTPVPTEFAEATER